MLGGRSRLGFGVYSVVVYGIWYMEYGALGLQGLLCITAVELRAALMCEFARGMAYLMRMVDPYYDPRARGSSTLT